MDVEGQEVAAVRSLVDRILDIPTMAIEIHLHEKDLEDVRNLYEILSEHGTLIDPVDGANIDELDDLTGTVDREFILWHRE